MQEAAKKDFTKMLLEVKSNDIALKENHKRSDKCVKEIEGSKSKDVIVEESSPKPEAKSEETKPRGRHKPHCRACGGKVKKNSEDASNHLNKEKCTHCKKDGGSDKVVNQSEESVENSGSDFSPTANTGNDRLRSGHARTHSIVINLDDNNRFTDEVTV